MRKNLESKSDLGSWKFGWKSSKSNSRSSIDKYFVMLYHLMQNNQRYRHIKSIRDRLKKFETG